MSEEHEPVTPDPVQPPIGEPPGPDPEEDEEEEEVINRRDLVIKQLAAEIRRIISNLDIPEVLLQAYRSRQ